MTATQGARGTGAARAASVAIAVVALAGAVLWWWARGDAQGVGRERAPASNAAKTPDEVPSPADAPADAPQAERTGAAGIASHEAVAPAWSSAATTRSIHGVVVTPEGAPIAGAIVQALEWRGAGHGSIATDAHGAFALEDLPHEAGRLHVSATGRCARIVTLEPPGAPPMIEFVSDPARIVLEAGVVAVARLRWTDGAPCAGIPVFLARDDTYGRVEGDPEVGTWPPPQTDADGRVVFAGLPPSRVVGLGIELFGRNRDQPRPFETGDATSAETAKEQLFTYARPGTLTVVLDGLGEIAERRQSATIRVERRDGIDSFDHKSVPPAPCTFEKLVVGGLYRVAFCVPGSRFVVLADRLKITEPDQSVRFTCVPPPLDRAPNPTDDWWIADFSLRDAAGGRVTVAQLEELGLWPCYLQVRYGSLDPRRADEEARRITVDFGDRSERELEARTRIRVRPPIWVEAQLLDARSRIEIGETEQGSRFDFTFDLARLAASRAEVTFRARDEAGRDVSLGWVEFTSEASREFFTGASRPDGSVARRLPPGRWAYHAVARGTEDAVGELEVPGAQPVDVDVVLHGRGAIAGTVAAMPPTAILRVACVPLDAARARFWGPIGTYVEPDGSYEIRSVPAGECVVMLQSDVEDEPFRVDTVSAVVTPGAVTRAAFAPERGLRTRFRFELGAVRAALVRATDDHGRILLELRSRPGDVVDLVPGPWHFVATPEIRDEDSYGYDKARWTEGVAAEADSTSTGSLVEVRFDFPSGE
jgi:hypothetical protein